MTVVGTRRGQAGFPVSYGRAYVTPCDLRCDQTNAEVDDDNDELHQGCHAALDDHVAICQRKLGIPREIDEKGVDQTDEYEGDAERESIKDAFFAFRNRAHHEEGGDRCDG